MLLYFTITIYMIEVHYYHAVCCAVAPLCVSNSIEALGSNHPPTIAHMDCHQQMYDAWW